MSRVSWGRGPPTALRCRQAGIMTMSNYVVERKRSKMVLCTVKRGRTTDATGVKNSLT